MYKDSSDSSQMDSPPFPNGECAISIFELCGVFINAMHAAKLIQVQAKGCWYLNVHISCLWAFATFSLVGNVLVWMSLQLQKQKTNFSVKQLVVLL